MCNIANKIEDLRELSELAYKRGYTEIAIEFAKEADDLERYNSKQTDRRIRRR